MRVMKLNTRNQLADLLNERGLRGSAAFIGCAECYFESHFLDRWPGRAYWIDPWKILDAPGFSGHGEDTDAGQEARYQRILRTAAKHGGRVTVMRATSEEAAPMFKDGSLQFVYFDSNHILCEVRKDLRLWFPKLSTHAVFAGHDHLDGMKGGVDYGVKTAVSEFACECGLTVNVTEESDYPSWWAVLP